MKKGYVVEFHQPYRPDLPMRKETTFDFCQTKAEIKDLIVYNRWGDTHTIKIYKANLELIEEIK